MMENKNRNDAVGENCICPIPDAIVGAGSARPISVIVDDCSAYVEGTRIAGTDDFVFGTWVTVNVKNGVSGDLYEGDINRGRSYTFLLLVDRIFTVK